MLCRGRLSPNRKKSEGRPADLAHRNQTDASYDAQINCSMASAASSSRHFRSPLPWENKGRRVRGEVQLPAQLKMAGGAGEATRATCHLRGLMVVVHSRRLCRAQVTLESAVDFVSVGCKPVKGTSVGNIIFTKIRNRDRKGAGRIPLSQ